MPKRIGIVGAGSIAQIHMDRWSRMPDVELAGYYDIDESAAQRAADRFGGQVYPSLEALLDDVEAVDICTTATAHREPVLAALEAGIPAVVEKPLSRHLADCEAIVDAQARTGTPLFVAHVVRFFPQFAQAKAVVESGAIGQPGVIRTVRGGSAPGGGGWGSQATARSYYGDFEKSGGVILDVGIHDIDFQRWCCGEVERVFARGLMFAGKEPKDHALIALRFASGAIGHIEASWAYPPGRFRTRLEIAGDKGIVEWDSLAPAPVQAILQGEDDPMDVQSRTSSPTAPEDDPFYAELAHFVRAVDQGRSPQVSAYDGLMAVKIALGAIESERQGKPIAIQP